MLHCRQCGGTFSSEHSSCPKDGTPLGPPVEPGTVDEVDAHSDTIVAEAVDGARPDSWRGSRSKAPPSSDQMLEEGTLLGGLYRVIGFLGQGGMGTVYEVEHIRLQKRFAAKVLRQALSAEPEYVTRLEREAVASSRIEHPNIVEVVNLDETEDGHVFLVAELLDGCDLAAALARRDFDAEESLSVTVQIARALQAAHDEGIVHRDLKPENIFLAKKHGHTVVKVLDFGISKVQVAGDTPRLTRTDMVVGTPLYMSPEHAHGDAEIDGRADVYSLGVILYELLVGRPPFVASKALEVMLKHVNETPAPPIEVRPEVPETLSNLVLKAIAKHPSDRYQTMDELALAIEAAAAELRLSIDKLPAAESLPRIEPRRLRRTTPGSAAITTPEQTLEEEVAGARKVAIAAVLLAFGLALYAGLAVSEAPSEQAPRRTPAATLVPTPAPPPEPPPPATPALPAQVEVSVESTPSGATVRRGDKVLGVTPITTRLDRSDTPVRLEIRLSGYRSEQVELVPNQARTMNTILRPEDKARPAPKSRPTTKLPEIRTTR